MYSIGLAMTLQPGAYEGYKSAHDRLWPEVAESMRSNEVSMAIYRDGDRLFLFAAAPSRAHWDCSRQVSILATWDETMTRFLATDADGHIAFDELPKAFGFGSFA
jgi:L-rhamnose mutarotase